MKRLLARRFSAAAAPASHPAFVLLRSEAIKEQSAHANLYRHTGTGAEVLSVVCPTDVEKVFGAAFLTVPGDDSGVAHILEHSVLCGSAKYPSKEPFVTLMATSLQTYLNAMTYPDRTVYPVASPNLADFYNLTRVYLDAVLSPRLGKWALAQEGWHLEVERQEGGGKPTLKASGVVYNEMKGVYSNADSLHAMACDAALFPDTHYSRSSGGDPLAITSLTLERYMAFHAENYHPSRARLWFYGDDPELKRLELLHEYLEPFSKSASSSSSSSSSSAAKRGVVAAARVHPDTMGTQAPFPEPRWVTLPYPAAAAGEEVEGEEGEEGEAGEMAQTVGVETASGGGAGAVEEHSPSTTISSSSGGSASTRAPIVRPLDHTSWSCASATREGYDATPPATHLPGHYATVNWCVGGGGVSVGELDPTTRLSLAILSHLLMGTQTATLRKALTDSGLGSSVTGGGYDDSGVQATFAAGLKGVAGKDVAKVQAVVLHALTMAGGAGFDASHVEASMNTVEFGLREFATGGGPKGLSLFLGAAGPWVHGGDPIEEMRYSEALEGVKRKVREEGGGRYFSGLVTRYLLSNPHRVTVHSWPDEAWGARRDEAERVWLEGVGRTLDKEERGWGRVEEDALELKRRQGEPDKEEDVALIPRLTLGDLDPKAPTLPFATVTAAAAGGQGPTSPPRAAFVSSLQDTAGIGYLRFYISAAHVPAHLLPLLPLLAWGLTSTGSARRDETQLSRAIGASTGGLGAGAGVWDTTLPDGSLVGIPYLSLAGKALGGKGEALGGLLQECLLESSLAKKERVVTYLKEKIARAESGMVSSGHSVASALLSVTQGGGAGEVSRMRDVLSGLTSLRVARVLLDRIERGEEGGWEGVVEDLHALRSALLAAPPPPPPSSASSTVPHVIAATIGDASLMGEFMACAEGVVKGIEGYGGSAAAGGGQSRLLVKQQAPRRTPLPQFPFPLTAEEHSRGVSIPGSNMGIDASDLSSLFSSSSSSGWGDPSPTLSALDFSVQVPASVNFVVKGGRIPGVRIIPPPPHSHTYPVPSPLTSVYRLPPALEPTLAFLRTGFLWERVRVAGGAYGAGVSLNYSTGTMSYHSYRDPNVGGTLSVFDGVGEALRGAVAAAAAVAGAAKGGGKKSSSLLEGPILSTIGSMDAPLSPVERGDKALNRWMHGVSPEQSQWWRDGVRGAGEGDILALAQAADSIAKGGRVAVVGNGEAGEKKVWVESRRGGVGAGAAAASGPPRPTLTLRPLEKGNSKKN